MATKIQLRRDSAANWGAQNPVLSEGELGYDTTNAKAKVGDGVSSWSALPFITDAPSSALIPGSNISLLTNDEGYLTTHQDLTGYATETWVAAQGYLTAHQDLTGYATETWVGTQGYLTAHQDISSKADITYVDSAVSNLVDSAPGALDTLNELAAALGDDPNFATTINNNIASKWTQDNAKITAWDLAASYGDHSTQGYLKAADIDLSGYATETWVNNEGFLKTVAFGDLTDKTITEYKQAIYDHGSVSGTVALDKANGSVQKLRADGNIDFTHNLDAGQTINLLLITFYASVELDVPMGLWADGENKVYNGQAIATIFFDGTNTWASINNGFTTV